MAPTGVTVRDPKSKPAEKASSGLTITSAVVKKGRPTVVKYSWTFNPQKCPGECVYSLLIQMPRILTTILPFAASLLASSTL